tara:strand:- start:3670 stop:4284 length:615 start_codon:yes stop_codon:yes gene_type:complete
MQTMEQQATDQLVSVALQKAMTYETYRNFIDTHAGKESSSGPEQSEALSNYTMLNQRRMKRLDKTLKLSDTTTAAIQNFGGDVTWLVLTETWCGDAAQSMPMMQKIAGLNEGISVKVILRDEHPEVMDQFLYNGSRSIPKLIAVDNKTQTVIGDWGPRPTKATQMVNNYKEKHGSLTPEFKQDLQLWYTKDKGQNTAEDLLKLL